MDLEHVAAARSIESQSSIHMAEGEICWGGDRCSAVGNAGFHHEDGLLQVVLKLRAAGPGGIFCQQTCSLA